MAAVKDFTERFSANTLQNLTPSNWDRLIRELNTRFNELEKIVPPLSAAEDLLLEIGLDRVNNVLAPAFEKAAELADLGLLFSASSSTLAIVQLGSIQFFIDPSVSETFTPASNLVITTPDDPDVAMFAQKVSYNGETGSLFVDVQRISGAGTFSNWKIDVGNPPNIVPNDAQVVSYNPPSGLMSGVDNVSDALDALASTPPPISGPMTSTDGGIARFDGTGGNLLKDSPSTVGTTDIADDSITEDKIADNAVVEAKIGSGAITSTKIANNAITDAKIQAGAVSSSKIPDGAIGNTKLATNAVTPIKVADNAVGNQPINLGLSVSASAGDLTISLKGADGSDPSSTNPVKIPFRNVTQANGTPTWLSVTGATSLVVPSGATLGTPSDQAIRLWVVGFNDGGTFRLGVINCLDNTSQQIFSLTEWALGSSTAIGTGADIAGVIYTGTAVASKAYKVLGFIEWGTSGIDVAGTWTTTNLNRLQIFGPGVPLPGSIVQVVFKTDNGGGATTSSSFVVSPVNISITPISAANVIKVIIGANWTITATNTISVARLSRGTSNGNNLFGSESMAGITDVLYSKIYCSGYNKPNTTGSQTYSLQVRRKSGTGGVTIVDEIYEAEATEIMS